VRPKRKKSLVKIHCVKINVKLPKNVLNRVIILHSIVFPIVQWILDLCIDENLFSFVCGFAKGSRRSSYTKSCRISQMQ